MEYTILGILLMILMLLYFKVADRFNIIDKPNQEVHIQKLHCEAEESFFGFRP